MGISELVNLSEHSMLHKYAVLLQPRLRLGNSTAWPEPR